MLNPKQKNVFLLEIQPVLVELHIWVFHDLGLPVKSFSATRAEEVGLWELKQSLTCRIWSLRCYYQTLQWYYNAVEYRIVSIRVKIWWIKLLLHLCRLVIDSAKRRRPSPPCFSIFGKSICYWSPGRRRQINEVPDLEEHNSKANNRIGNWIKEFIMA